MSNDEYNEAYDDGFKKGGEAMAAGLIAEITRLKEQLFRAENRLDTALSLVKEKSDRIARMEAAMAHPRIERRVS